jgi:hypothetical protein
MPRTPSAQPDAAWLRRAAASAARRGGYLAGLLQTYQQRESLDEQQLGERLQCPVEALPLLGLCLEPRRDAGQFARDVRTIAERVSCDAGALANVVRTVDSWRAFEHIGTHDPSNVTLAAREDPELDVREGQGEQATDEPARPDEHKDGASGSPD